MTFDPFVVVVEVNIYTSFKVLILMLRNAHISSSLETEA